MAVDVIHIRSVGQGWDAPGFEATLSPHVKGVASDYDAPPADWRDVPNSVYHVSSELFTLHQILFQFIQPHFILHMKWRGEGSEGEDGGKNTSLQFVCMWSQLHTSPCGRLLVRKVPAAVYHQSLVSRG